MNYLAFFVIVVTSFFALKANDTTATIAAGVIEYTKSSDISMDQEVLKISPEHIDIDYIFTNRSTREITSQVVFPLPRSPFSLEDTASIFPDWDELYRAYCFINEAKEASKLPYEQILNNPLTTAMNQTAFTDFKRTINGSEYAYNFVARAIHQDGQDITSLLIQNNIPLSALYVNGFQEAGLIHKDPNLRRKLQKLGLVDNKDRALWQLQISYIWQQRFAPQETVHVTHHYQPYVGNHYLSGKASSTIDNIKFYHRDVTTDGQPEVKKLKHYCPSKEDISTIENMFSVEKKLKHEVSLSDDMSYRVKEVRYVLSTGAHWKGPIKKFRLEIAPPYPSTRVITCFPVPLQKNEQNIYIAELDNFTPIADLKILFVDSNFETINVEI